MKYSLLLVIIIFSFSFLINLDLRVHNQSNIPFRVKSSEPQNGHESLLLGNKIDINRAGIEDLIAISGIGEATAEKIVKFRTVNGGFKSIDDLLKVKGIGLKKLDLVRAYLR